MGTKSLPSSSWCKEPRYCLGTLGGSSEREMSKGKAGSVWDWWDSPACGVGVPTGLSFQKSVRGVWDFSYPLPRLMIAHLRALVWAD